uniref:Mitogen-activated protein kinase kinase kinase 1 n=2 Tax=Chenopodium quinoa TaxID=63459 RepID=A0A803LFK9_CHEQI
METKTPPKDFSPSNQQHQHHDRHPCKCTPPKPTLQAFTERVTNALLHHIFLLYRSDPEFYVLGATGNVYIVNISITPSCTCPDRTTPCKHILFVLIKVLGFPLDDPGLRRQTISPCHLEKLQATPSSPVSLASHTLRQRFHQVFFLKKELGLRNANLKPCMKAEVGGTCPICLEMGRSGDRMVACETCRIPIHEECLMTWKRTQRKELTKCLTCRSQWKQKGDQQRYLNLSDYVSEDETSPKTERS